MRWIPLFNLFRLLFRISAQVKVFVTGLFSLNQDIPAFKEHLRDFLVQIKVCAVRLILYVEFLFPQCSLFICVYDKKTTLIQFWA